MYQQHLNESLAIQHRQDRIYQASAERDLRAMRLEQRSQARTEGAGRPSALGPNGRLGRALNYLGALATFWL